MLKFDVVYVSVTSAFRVSVLKRALRVRQCVCVCACVRACVRASVYVCIYSSILQLYI